MYYASEEGLFMGHISGSFGTSGRYRGPGNSFLASDPAMQKYYRACVDWETGEPQNCTYELRGVRKSCIECIDNCTLDLCPDELTWCPKYEIKDFESHTEVSHLGFIPYTSYCLTEEGIFSQEPGMIVQRNGSFGDCLYGDRETIVNRSLPADYQYFHDQEVCEIFEGGFRTDQCDPRYRPWYINCRELQRPSWTPVYGVGASSTYAISYASPVRLQVEETDPRQVFQGVLLVDIMLTDLTEFLREPNDVNGITLEAQGLSLFLYEAEEPHNWIASSTEQVVQPYTHASEVQTPDLVFSHAYSQQQELGHPNEPVDFEVKEGPEAGKYLALSLDYDSQGGINWICLVVLRVA